MWNDLVLPCATDPDLGEVDWEDLDLEAEASGYEGAIYGPDHPAGQSAGSYDWCLEADWPITRTIDGLDEKARIAWMRIELAEATHDGWQLLLEQPILEPVVAIEIEHEDGSIECCLWDGNHRVGASLMTGRRTVPAIVGRLRSAGAAA